MMLLQVTTTLLLSSGSRLKIFAQISKVSELSLKFIARKNKKFFVQPDRMTHLHQWVKHNSQNSGSIVL